jgi:hypothetical protein
MTLLALVTFEPASRPNAILSLPWVLLARALNPTAVFPDPGPPFGESIVLPLFKRAAVPTAVLLTPKVLNKSAAAPKAVLLSLVLKSKAPAPIAVLRLPSVSLKREYQPMAVFAEPAVRLKRAF